MFNIGPKSQYASVGNMNHVMLAYDEDELLCCILQMHSFIYLFFCVFDQKVNFAKLGTNTLWRYYSTFNLVSHIPLWHCTSPTYLHYLILELISPFQGNMHSNPTKEHLVNAIQKHFATQVPQTHIQK